MSGRGWVSLGAALLAGWMGLVVLMAGLQRRLIFPAPRVQAEVLANLAEKAGAIELRVPTDDGERLYGWRVPGQGERRPLVVYFSGNGSTVGAGPERLDLLRSTGAEVLHVNYRGYPGSSGEPSEAGLRSDARAIWAEARRTHVPSEIVLLGKSLGGGVAVGLAAEQSRAGAPPRALVVESSFRSILDIAREAYPFLPVRRLLQHPFDSMALAPRVTCPTLVTHGARDRLIDVQHGRDLATAIPGARYVEVPGAEHNDLLLRDDTVWAAFLELSGAPP